MKELLSVRKVIAAMLVVLWCAPSFPLPWWFHVAIIGMLIMVDIKGSFEYPAVLAFLLPLLACIAEFHVSHSKSRLIPILGFWLPQLSIYLAARVALRKYSATAAMNILLLTIAGALLFLFFDAVGVDLHSLLPSYKNADVTGLSEGFMEYGDERRFRGFFGEASSFSGTVVYFNLVAIGLLVSQKTRISARSVLYKFALGFFGLSLLLAVVLPLSKAGALVLLAAVPAGFIWVLLDRKLAVASVIGFAGLAVAAGVFFGSSKINRRVTDYVRTEIANAQDAATEEQGSSGSSSRKVHWTMTREVLDRYPLGAGHTGIKQVFLEPHTFTPNYEMQMRIPADVYGMMNASADIATLTGWPGIIASLLILLTPAARAINLRRKRRCTTTQVFIVLALTSAAAAYVSVVETFFFLSLFALLEAAAREITREPEPVVEEEYYPEYTVATT